MWNVLYGTFLFRMSCFVREVQEFLLNFIPEGLTAASVVFHFTGMFGTSEADAESTGGALKRFAKSLSTPRVVESTILRSAGLSGCGGAGEYGFLVLRWADRSATETNFLSTIKTQRSASSVIQRAEVLRRLSVCSQIKN